MRPTDPFRRTAAAALATLIFALGGCTYVGFEAAYLIRDEQAFNDNIRAAQAGDPVAQYEVGKSRCCAVGESRDLYYSTRDATAWLCASARQGYGPAMRHLGHIYSGEAFEDFRVFRSGAAAFGPETVNRSIAFVWYRLALDYGVAEAGVDVHRLRDELSPREAAIADALLRDPNPKPCVWDDVMDPLYREIFEMEVARPEDRAHR